MSAPVTLLLIVGLGGGEIQPGQLRATLIAQLDSSLARVELRKANGATEGAVEAAALRGPVAVVSNPRPGRLEVRLALQPGQWVLRAFTFERRDPLKERNRTVALALAAMMPDWRLPVPLPEPEADEDDSAVPTLSEPDPVDAGVPTGEAPAKPPDAGTTDTQRVAVTPSREPTASSNSGLAVEAGVGAGVWPLGPGALLGGGYCIGPFCVGAQLRGARAELGDAKSVIWHLAPSVTGRVQRLVLGEWLRVAVMLAVGPGWTLAQRSSQAQDCWQFEASLDGDVSARVTPELWVFLRAGLGVVSGATPILVNDRQVAELPPVWGQAAAGFRFGP